MGSKAPSINIPAVQPAPAPPAGSAPISNNTPEPDKIAPGQSPVAGTQGATAADIATKDAQEKAITRAKARAAAAKTILTTAQGLQTGASIGKPKLGQ